tara:strand:+ start:5049 stop:5240 length:192 start_codon:yes stop_codon:yes gene_type:complete
LATNKLQIQTKPQILNFDFPKKPQTGGICNLDYSMKVLGSTTQRKISLIDAIVQRAKSDIVDE